MKYISVDIETTGLDSEKHTIVQFGAVLEDTENILPLEELPRFECLLNHPEYVGTPYALGMHAELFKELANPTGKTFIFEFYEVAEKFQDWLKSCGFELDEKNRITINVAGKNFGTFDKLFIEKLPNWNKKIKIRQRIIDPSILYWDPIKDETLPSLEECKKRAGLSHTTVLHTAVEDALDVIEILRKKY